MTVLVVKQLYLVDRNLQIPKELWPGFVHYGKTRKKSIFAIPNLVQIIRSLQSSSDINMELFILWLSNQLLGSNFPKRKIPRSSLSCWFRVRVRHSWHYCSCPDFRQFTEQRFDYGMGSRTWGKLYNQTFR